MKISPMIIPNIAKTFFSLKPNIPKIIVIRGPSFNRNFFIAPSKGIDMATLLGNISANISKIPNIKEANDHLTFLCCVIFFSSSIFFYYTKKPPQ